MTIPRRQLLVASALLPTLAACATRLPGYRDRPVAALAGQLQVCAATYVTLKAGRPAPATRLSGCSDSAATAPGEAIYQAASLTKPVTAFGALRLALDGALDLQAPVSRYLPDGYVHYHSVLARSLTDASDRVPASLLSEVPVAALLNHSAGLPNWASGTLSPQSRPGERWAYSGEGYVLLQAVIEAVTGLGFAVYFDSHVFGPLGMQDTSLVRTDAFGSRLQAGTSPSGALRELRFAMPVAAASLHTTATDYARFMAALLADDRLLALTMSKPVKVAPELGLEWGLGWGIERNPSGVCLWQWGNNPGFRSFAMASVSSKDGFVLLTNSESGMPLAVPLARSTIGSEHNAFRFGMVG